MEMIQMRIKHTTQNQKKKLFEDLLSPQNDYQSKPDGYSTPIINSQFSDTNNKRFKLDLIDESPSTSNTLSGKKLGDHENQFKGTNKFHNYYLY